MHADTLFWLGLCLLSIFGIGSGFTVPEGLTNSDEPLLEMRDAAEAIREHDPLESHVRSAAASSAARSFFRDNSEPTRSFFRGNSELARSFVRDNSEPTRSFFRGNSELARSFVRGNSELARSYVRDNSEAVRSPSTKALSDAMAAYRKTVAAAVMKTPEQVRSIEPDRLPLRYIDLVKPVEPSKNIDQIRYMEALTQLGQSKSNLPLSVPIPLRYLAQKDVEPMDSVLNGDEIIPIGRMNDDGENYEYHYFDDDDDFNYARNNAEDVRPTNYIRADEFHMIPENEESMRNADEEMIRMAHDSTIDTYLQNSENQMRMEAAKSAAAAAAAARSAAAAAAARSAAAAAAVAARSAGTRSASSAAVRSAAAAAAASRSAAAKSVAAAARSAAAAAAAA